MKLISRLVVFLYIGILFNLDTIMCSESALVLHENLFASDPKWPLVWPYYPSDFSREDETTDSSFYLQPRFNYHIDAYAVSALTDYYKSVFTNDGSHLDICSSWISHYPKEVTMRRSVGLGLNRDELKVNPQLTEYIVQDLNIDTRIALPDNTIDIVTCVVSVDYLIKPLEVFSEVLRILKPGGMFIISQSNRCFPSKAINMWLHTDDHEHLRIIGNYFHFTEGFSAPEAYDISPNRSRSDPMYIVQARKL